MVEKNESVDNLSPSSPPPSSPPTHYKSMEASGVEWGGVALAWGSLPFPRTCDLLSALILICSSLKASK